jgi:putative transcriptional regulator
MARNEFFEGILSATEELIDDLRHNRPLRTTEVIIPDAPKPMAARQIARLRKDKLRVSQAVFAELLNTAPQTVHAWEQGRNKPSGIALRFLRVIEQHPEVLHCVCRKATTTTPAARRRREPRHVHAKSAQG